MVALWVLFSSLACHWDDIFQMCQDALKTSYMWKQIKVSFIKLILEGWQKDLIWYSITLHDVSYWVLKGWASATSGKWCYHPKLFDPTPIHLTSNSFRASASLRKCAPSSLPSFLFKKAFSLHYEQMIWALNLWSCIL